MAEKFWFRILQVQILLNTIFGLGIITEKCPHPVGMSNGNISDKQITASSSHDVKNVGPQNARLKMDKKGGAWCPKPLIDYTPNEYVEIDMKDRQMVTGVELQGRYGAGKGIEYTPHIQIEYFELGVGWNFYGDMKGNKILEGNSDTSTVVRHTLDIPVYANKIRFLPMSFHKRVTCLRVEIYVCNLISNISSSAIFEPNIDEDGEKKPSKYGPMKIFNGLTQLIDGVYGDKDYLSIIDAKEAHKTLFSDASFVRAKSLKAYHISENKVFRWMKWSMQKVQSNSFNLTYEFKDYMKIDHIYLQAARISSKSIEVFKKANVFYSIDGNDFYQVSVSMRPSWTRTANGINNITLSVNITGAKQLKIEIFFKRTYVMLSETWYGWEYAEGNITEYINERNFTAANVRENTYFDDGQTEYSDENEIDKKMKEEEAARNASSANGINLRKYLSFCGSSGVLKFTCIVLSVFNVLSVICVGHTIYKKMKSDNDTKRKNNKRSSEEIELESSNHAEWPVKRPAISAPLTSNDCNSSSDNSIDTNSSTSGLQPAGRVENVRCDVHRTCSNSSLADVENTDTTTDIVNQVDCKLSPIYDEPCDSLNDQYQQPSSLSNGTRTKTGTSSATASATETGTSSATETGTSSATETGTSSATASATGTGTSSATASGTETGTSSATASETETGSEIGRVYETVSKTGSIGDSEIVPSCHVENETHFKTKATIRFASTHGIADKNISKPGVIESKCEIKTATDSEIQPAHESAFGNKWKNTNRSGTEKQCRMENKIRIKADDGFGPFVSGTVIGSGIKGNNVAIETKTTGFIEPVHGYKYEKRNYVEADSSMTGIRNGTNSATGLNVIAAKPAVSSASRKNEIPTISKAICPPKDVIKPVQRKERPSKLGKKKRAVTEKYLLNSFRNNALDGGNNPIKLSGCDKVNVQKSTVKKSSKSIMSRCDYLCKRYYDISDAETEPPQGTDRLASHFSSISLYNLDNPLKYLSSIEQEITLDKYSAVHYKATDAMLQRSRHQQQTNATASTSIVSHSAKLETVFTTMIIPESLNSEIGKGTNIVRYDSAVDLSAGQFTELKCIGKFYSGSIKIGKLITTVEEHNGKFKNLEQFVLIKLLKHEISSINRDRFFEECRRANKITHLNISHIVGIRKKENPYCIIQEYSSLGDLASYFRKRCKILDNRDLSFNFLMKCIIQIVDGLKYLEEEGIIHSDMAARNCLIHENMVIKISDHAMYTKKFNSEYYVTDTNLKVPLRWLAWESCYLNTYTRQSVVWSFGMTVWEILSLCTEIPYANKDDDQVFVNIKHFGHDCAEKEIPHKPIFCPDAMYTFLRTCWDRWPKARPSLNDLSFILPSFMAPEYDVDLNFSTLTSFI